MKTEIKTEPVPSHFFDRGPYEVWGSKSGSSATVEKIADGLTLEAARAFKWSFKEIRLNGKRVN